MPPTPDTMSTNQRVFAQTRRTFSAATLLKWKWKGPKVELSLALEFEQEGVYCKEVCDCMLLSLFIVVFLRLSTLHTYTYSMDRKFAYVHYMYLYVLRNCSAFEVNGLFDSQFLGKSVPWQQGLRRMSFRL